MITSIDIALILGSISVSPPSPRNDPQIQLGNPRERLGPQVGFGARMAQAEIKFGAFYSSC